PSIGFNLRPGIVTNQSRTQNNPKHPMTRKGNCHVFAGVSATATYVPPTTDITALRNGSSGSSHRSRYKTTNGVMTAPSAVPLPKSAFPNDRSSGRITVRVVRMPHGQFPASKKPRANRHMSNIPNVVAYPVRMPTTDQPNTING